MTSSSTESNNSVTNTDPERKQCQDDILKVFATKIFSEFTSNTFSVTDNEVSCLKSSRWMKDPVFPTRSVIDVASSRLTFEQVYKKVTPYSRSLQPSEPVHSAQLTLKPVVKRFDTDIVFELPPIQFQKTPPFEESY
jgi:hypothetical protein